MPAFGRVSGVWKELDPRVNIGGVWKNVSEGYVKVAGVWERFYTRFNISVSPDEASFIGAGPGTFTTNSVTVTAEGTGPFTYSWARSGGDSRVTAVSPTSATTAFRASIGVELVTAEFIVTVTDTSTGDALFLTVNVTIDGTAV